MPPDLPQASSPLTDTDPNLHRATVKIPLPLAGSGIEKPNATTTHRPPIASANQPPDRDAVSTPAPPTPPPVLGPPPSSHALLGSPPAHSSAVASDMPLLTPAPDDSQFTQVPTIDRIHRSRKSAARGHWLSIVLLSALVFIVLLLLLIFALPG